MRKMSVTQQCQTQSSVNVAHLSVVRTLGEGSFGEVKLLVDKNDSNIAVAVKIVDLEKHKSQADNVKREALLQKYLRDHINVLKYINTRVTPDNHFQLFLEYADGGELFDRIEPDFGMHSEKAKFYFAQLVSGLEYVHSKGIVHRDIKPENLLLTKRDILKISDFGMATIFRHQGRERLLDTRCGTWPYVAPEVLTQKYRGPPIDLWSAGVVLVAMLVGELPWEYPNKTHDRFRQWIDGEAYNTPPWSRINTLPLSLLKGVLDADPAKRADVDRIMNHPWFSEELAVADDHHINAKRRKQCDDSDPPVNFSQPPELVSLRNNFNEALKQSQREEMKGRPIIDICGPQGASFTQPDNIESLLLTKSQVDPTQSVYIHPIQKLAKRMTRFCVIISVAEALKSLTKICEASGFRVKMPIPQQMLVMSHGAGKHELSFMVTVFDMVEVGQHKVLADFRRSKGDGIEFKRTFMRVKRQMESVICNDSYDWLLNNGLLCSEQLEALRLASRPATAMDDSLDRLPDVMADENAVEEMHVDDHDFKQDHSTFGKVTPAKKATITFSSEDEGENAPPPMSPDEELASFSLARIHYN